LVSPSPILQSWIPLISHALLVILAVIFVAMTFTRRKNVGAVFGMRSPVLPYNQITALTTVTEWIISLVFTFYVLSFSIDLFPAAKDKQLKGNLEQGELGNPKHGAGHEMTPQNGYANGYANGDGLQHPVPNDGSYPTDDRYHANGGTGYTEPAVNGVYYGNGASRPIVAAQNF